jgi:hypothetical protein
MKITKILKIDPDKLEIKAEFQKDDGTKEKRNVQIKEFRKKRKESPLLQIVTRKEIFPTAKLKNDTISWPNINFRHRILGKWKELTDVEYEPEELYKHSKPAKDE